MLPTYRLLIDIPAENIQREIITRFWACTDHWHTDDVDRVSDGLSSQMHHNRQAAEVSQRGLVRAAILLGTALAKQRAIYFAEV